jgi:hypothetical protein
MNALLGFIKSLLLSAAICAVLALTAAVVSWKWLFVMLIGLAVYYVGVTAILGRQRLATIPGNLVMAGVVLFFFYKLFVELADWTLHGDKSNTLQDIMQPVVSGFNEIFLFDAGGLCSAQQEYYWARAAILLIFLFGLVRLFRR